MLERIIHRILERILENIMERILKNIIAKILERLFHECYIIMKFSIFLNGIQQGKNYGFGGDFYGFGLWEMKFLNIP